jgi:pimeloyl-ACP methyl ester carboxylesterase
LENNPLSSPVGRDMSIYLPPDYYENESKRYPVIYFLHGYSGNNRGWTITSETSKEQAIPLDLIPKKILKRIDLDRILYFEKLDELILNGHLRSFILVQPDGSLHVPSVDNRKDFRGNLVTKGSFYANSPHTGNYRDYIVKDVLGHVDKNFRTIPDRDHRTLMGGSMGGYGTLHIISFHPECFSVAASLSPGNIGTLDLFKWKLRIPIYEEIFGSKINAELGDSSWRDILYTYDLIFSKEQPLIPSIKLDENGEIVEFDEQAYENWKKFDLIFLAERYRENLKKVDILLNCEKNDEFGLARIVQAIHEKYEALTIKHEFDLYSDPNAQLSPHMFGIGYNILPAIKFCMNKLKH